MPHAARVAIADVTRQDAVADGRLRALRDRLDESAP
jgi:hypothetical protein